ncbi:hypothetical protein D3C71_1958200 [compost metagenome]
MCRHARNHQIGITLVIAKQDVVLRVLGLDQVVFQQQRLGLGAHHRGFQARDLADHVADARAAMAFLEVVGDAALEIARLADIQQAALGIEVAIDAGQ